MDLADQLKNLFPDHQPEPDSQAREDSDPGIWMQEAPLLCKYEKRKGKPITIVEGYTGAESDFKELTRKLQRALHVGGSYKGDRIIIQGDYRDRIMELLHNMGFTVKRVGG